MDNDGYVAGWGTLSLINAGLAQGKGRSGLAWFIVSLPLGPVATLLVVALPAVPLIAPKDGAGAVEQRGASGRA